MDNHPEQMHHRIITLFMRLITRADFDGIVCGVLLTSQEAIDSFLFVEPKSMQDSEVEISDKDIIANLPYHPKCALWFDHHITNRIAGPFRGDFRIAPSAARVVYDYYSSDSLRCYDELVFYADRIDSGNLEVSDILDPHDYVLLSFTIDPKEKSDEPYWRELIRLLRDLPIAAVMEHAEVKTRCRQVLEDFKTYHELVLKNARQESNVVVMDFRNEDFQGSENRFLVYTLFPEATVSVRIFKDSQREGRVGISVGKNIFNKASTINVGELLSEYGGGGHEGAGSSRVPEADADRVLQEIIQRLKKG